MLHGLFSIERRPDMATWSQYINLTFWKPYPVVCVECTEETWQILLETSDIIAI
jgi:hypothetical protein